MLTLRSCFLSSDLQILAAISVSTGCVSYGICMAYTSSAIPSMLAPNNSLTIEIGTYETTWMSKQSNLPRVNERSGREISFIVCLLRFSLIVITYAYDIKLSYQLQSDIGPRLLCNSGVSWNNVSSSKPPSS